MIFTLRNGTDVDSFIDDNTFTVGTASTTGPGPTGVPLPKAFSSGLVAMAAVGLGLFGRRRRRSASA